MFVLVARGRAPEHATGGMNAHDARPSTDLGAIAHRRMVAEPRLTTDETVAADPCAAGQSDLRRDHGSIAHDAVVADVHVVVEFDVDAQARLAESRAIPSRRQ